MYSSVKLTKRQKAVKEQKVVRRAQKRRIFTPFGQAERKPEGRGARGEWVVILSGHGTNLGEVSTAHALQQNSALLGIDLKGCLEGERANVVRQREVNQSAKNRVFPNHYYGSAKQHEP